MDLKSFIGGCLGGFAGIISSYPFDTIKVRMQNQHVLDSQYKGAIDCLTKTIKNESAHALYKGLSSPLFGSMFINAVLFGVEENVRKVLHINDPKLNEKIAHSNSLEYYKLFAISGAIAGFTQAIILSPVELIKIKMQIPKTQYKSSLECAKDLLKTNGYKYLMRGTGLTILRDVPAVSTYFISFEYICNSYGKARDHIPVTQILMAGGLAGCVSWVVTYPIDVIKTRFQADKSYLNVRDCFSKTIATEGSKGLWRGLAPTLLRAFPNNASIFATVTVFNRLANRAQNKNSNEADVNLLGDYDASTINLLKQNQNDLYHMK